MNELVIPVLTFLSVVSLGGAVLTARAARKRALEARLQGLEPNRGDALEAAGQLGAVRVLGRIGSLLSHGGPSAGLREELSRAGYHSRGAATVYIGAKMLLLFIGLFGLAILLLPLDRPAFSIRLLGIGCGSAVLFMLPNAIVRHRRRARMLEVQIFLADVIDLLEVCVSAGMGLDMAWNAVADEIRPVSRTLGDEMALTNLEIHLGATRAVAMRHMAERTGAEAISSLVSVLVQSDRFGTSIADALRTFAGSMREIRGQRAEEAAEKMPVKLLFPMILLIFPALLVVLAGPAAINWMRVIHGG